MYREFFGLERLPFQLTPDPHFFFEGDAHKRALSYLFYGLDKQEGFIVVTGEVGLGGADAEENWRQRIAQIPIGEPGQPVDVANCILFLASEDARHVTGAELVVDGGMTAI